MTLNSAWSTAERRNHEEQRAALNYRLTYGLPPLRLLPQLFSARYVKNRRLAKKVRVYLLPLFEGFGNGKSAPAHQLLLDIEEETKGVFPKLIVVVSSGNTVANIAYEAPWFGVEIVVAVIEETVSAGKVGQIRRANGDVEIVRVSAGTSTIEVAERIAKERGGYFVNQYVARGSVTGHENFTWPHVMKELCRLGIVPSFICAALGTTSVFVSAHCLQRVWPDLQIVGAACAPSQIIPGARTVEKLKMTGFGYENMIGDRLILSARDVVDKMGEDLYRNAACSGGPTTAMTIGAGFEFINSREEMFMDREVVNFVVLGMDAAAPYYSEYA